MSKLIEFKNICENKVCNDTGKLLVFIKNILLSSKRNKLFFYPEGYLMPIRWSSNLDQWVIDLGTNLDRDIKGITLKNIDFYFNNNIEFKNKIKSLLVLLRKNKNIENYYNLQKNENKFIAVYYSIHTETYYNIGLFTYTNSKKRSGPYSKDKKSLLIDNSNEFKDKINSILPDIISSDCYVINNYRNVFSDFINYINNISCEFTINNTVKKVYLKECIEKKLKFKYNYTNKRNKEILLNKKVKSSELNDFLENILRYWISFELYNFLIKNKHILDYAYYFDEKTGINYILKSNTSAYNKLETKESEEDYANSNSFLMPVIL